MKRVKIFSNTATKYLFDKIAHVDLVDKKDNLIVEKFSNGEISVKFENSIRGYDIFLFCETSLNLTELLLTLDAAKRASAKSITLILPNYGYGRQDKREGNRGCLGASMIAHVLGTMGISRIVSIDLHAEQIQGFFAVPVEHIYGHAIFCDYIKSEMKEQLDNIVFCSPDAGGIHRVEYYSNHFNRPMVSINKRRDKPSSIASMQLIGEVKGKDVVIIDDMVDTAGTLKKATAYLYDEGALSVNYIATHPILSGNGYENIANARLNKFITSDTLERFYTPKMKCVSCVPVLEQVILRLINEGSVSELNH